MKDIHAYSTKIRAKDRQQLTGHKGIVLWFYGLSGSGKSTVANALEVALHAKGKHTYLLDGDNLRMGLNKDLGFSPEDRSENIRRNAEVAKLMVDAGLIVLAAFITPMKTDRLQLKTIIGDQDLIPIFVDCPLDLCEARDPKGLYKKARAGEIQDFTGIDAPFEIDKTDFKINTKDNDIETIVAELVQLVELKTKQ